MGEHPVGNKYFGLQRLQVLLALLYQLSLYPFIQSCLIPLITCSQSNKNVFDNFGRSIKFKFKTVLQNAPTD